MSERIEAIVSGKVQLVMYRDFAQRMAWLHKLSGEVQNRKDGTVRVIAEGERAALQKYLHKLEGGPLLARVDAVRVTWTPATGEYKKFSITYVD